MIEVNDETFMKEVSDCAQPVLVCFGTHTCGPCRMMVPILEKLEANCPKVKIVKVYAEEAPDISAQFAIRHVPALVLFKNNKDLDALIGFQSEAKLKEWLKLNGVCD